ncbi:MAG: hypothetical protein J0I06_11140 [Planctomycetes bacterium]|nr:hypothetical protein [Planctomycetota bacterium]
MTARNAERGTRNAGRFLSIVLALSAAPARLDAQSTDVHARVEGAPQQVALSGWMRVTLVLEGPKPLRVELPDPLLTADANGVWRIRPDGPAELAPAGNGRERWRRAYRLTPYPPPAGDPAGKRVVSFNPVTVSGRPVTWPPIEVEVTKSVGDLTTPPRAPVGVEDPPDPIRPPPEPSPIPWIAAAAGLVLAAALIVVLVRKRRAKPVPPHERALSALTQLLAANDLGAEASERVAAVLRRFVEQRLALPATKLTTTELLSAARAQGWPVEQADALGTILDECDRAKFAGDVPDDDGCRRLVRLAVDWVHDVGRPAGPW